MSLFAHLPPEVVRLVCHRLSLEDVISLLDTYPSMDILVRNTLFRDMRKLDVDWNAKGATLTFSGASLWQSMSIHTSSNFWEDVVKRAVFIKELSITKTDDAKDYNILEVICRQHYRVRRLEIKLRSGQRTVSQNTVGLSYQKLTSFVRHLCRGLSSLRLETDPKNSVEVLCDTSSAVCHFSHQYDSSLCNRLITPMFNAMLSERFHVTFVTLRVDWGERADLILQSAFHAALPLNHRSRVLVLRLELGSGIASENNPEIHKVLSGYAPYLNSINRLQHFICDLRQSQMDPAELENLYTTMSQELSNERHSISLITNAIACQ